MVFLRQWAANMVADDRKCNVSANPRQPAHCWPLLLAALAVACAVATYACTAVQLPGYRHDGWPFAWAGAHGQPTALLFNLGVLILPGLSLAAVAWQLRRRLPHGFGWRLRLGAQLLLIATLMMAAQGLWPLDAQSLHAHSTRWHATAWALWLIAGSSGAVLLALGNWRMPRGRVLALASAGLAVALPLLAVAAPAAGAGPWVQHLAWLAWGLWWLVCGWHLWRDRAIDDRGP